MALCIFLLSAGLAVFLSWPSLTNYGIYKSDIRQSPHWASYHHDTFQDDDLLVRYGSFNESPLQNLIYYFGTFFLEMITLTKILSVLSFGLGAVLFFYAGLYMHGRETGILMALFFTFFPDQFDWSAGFFSRFWMEPLLLAVLVVLHSQKWRWLMFLLPICGLAYPPSVIIITATLSIFIVIKLFEDRTQALEILKWTSWGAGIVMVFLLAKYFRPAAEIGSMTSGADLRQMPEMYSGGLTIRPYLPVRPVFDELMERAFHPFTVWAGIGYIAVLGPRRMVWHRSWTAMLLASLLCYILADNFFMHLYLPSRYIKHSLAVLLIFWHASCIFRIYQLIPWKTVGFAAILAILGLAAFAYHDDYRQTRNAFDRRRYTPMCEFIRDELPPKILIAGHPEIMDDVTVQGKRSVLCNRKMAHPWFPEYYREISQRTRDTFHAIYGMSPGQINVLYHKYGVNYLVIDSRDFGRNLKKQDIYVRPYNTWILKMIDSRRSFYLKNPPQEAVVYHDRNLKIIRLPLSN